MLLAFGGVPVDRKNREQAVKALGAAAASAKMGDCIAVAPEGTRSKSGQLLPFKKGPFHMWDTLKTPIVPIIIYGAFDLYPPGRQMTIPGKVYVRFLPPIYAKEAENREQMSQLLRTKMLEAIKNGPKDVGAPLTWRQRLENVFALLALFGSHYYAYKWANIGEILKYYDMPFWKGCLFVLLVAMAFTVSLYLYLLYISNWISKLLRLFRRKENKPRK